MHYASPLEKLQTFNTKMSTAINIHELSSMRTERAELEIALHHLGEHKAADRLWDNYHECMRELREKK